MNTIKSVMTLKSCENLKIFRQRKYQIYPVIVALILIGGAAVSMIPGNVLGFTMANYPYTVLSMLNYVFAPLAIFMLVSDLLSNEMAGDEIKVMLTRPVSRVNVLFAKIFAIAGYIGVMFAGGFLISGILSILSAGFSAVNILSALLAYIVGFIPMLTFITMSTLIASMSKSGTSCFSFCLFAYIGSMVLGLVFSSLSPALFTSYLGIGSMVIGSSIPVTSLLIGISILAGYALAFFSVSGIKFVGREF